MEVASPDPDGHRYVVTDWPEWQPYRGAALRRIEHIQDPLTGPAGVRLAARLWFDRQPPVTVALGGAEPGGAVTYVIDQLVVFHDDAVARTYLEHLARRETTVDAEVALGALDTARRARHE